MKTTMSTIIKESTLLAPDSPKRAFYHIALAKTWAGMYEVLKESGVSVKAKKVCDRRTWYFWDPEKATKFYDTKVAMKLRGKKKGGRTYILN